MSEPILKIRNIESFYGPIMAIRGVSLDVHEGRVVSILGANGAGKTTLMKTVSGVMDPEKGTITFAGQEIQGSEPHKVVQQGIVHVPEGREVFPLLTVDENLSLGAYTSTDKGQIEHDRELVFSYFPILKERRNQEAGTLSGGQQQMLAIGRGLMANPRIMLLDEPSLGLSPLLVQEIFAILKRLNEEQNMTMMLVEQNASAALNLAHDGYVMEVGRIVMDGTAEQLMASEDIQNFYLGVQEEGERENRRWKRKKTWR
ncbi:MULTISPECIES: ABC transporter ATP-binding protein [Roseobacteraceae]|jgi:branched-chain amino acid transport system ATP-binding protein|uniref:High-affinity branched-chain amino acid transport ATP-binding protein LivF n=2 Tax=Falsiruegeria TaxID=2854184 RepID=A0A1Y5SGN8_9RHOB|nr:MULTISPECIES: ABC transporter ATP-binding protein [Roseobacteraceae]MBO9449645.1 ABC transporter ATP-binding protein [Tropicibacter sp. R16_0]SLN39710.1 High-affinity branched-chain amino acid transport ATP-binding protein LivF [Falsiruegeria litorea R37]SPJ28759.1 High-affinity branched-chain amino acid transport ATP-binding protein LivF [Falsiruegeria mediterranea M17]